MIASPLRRICGTAAIAAAVLLAQPAEAQESRVALVIGNARYVEAPLKNPVNDARAMAASLKARGFEVIARENATRSQMESAIADFGEKLNEGATGLFFFAGHGMQVQGRNYLVPVDARITSEQRVKLETVDVDVVLDQMQAARTRVSMVILDACRNNPFERRFRSLNGGMAQINAPEGTLIAYATAPGKVAADGDGSNGLYTQEFLKALTSPGLKVEDVFKQVRVNVSRASNGMQVPWEASSLTGDFYFVPPAPVAATPQIQATPQTLDLAFWEAVKGSANPVELQAYLDTFPNGTFAPLARSRMAAMRAPSPTPTAGPAPAAAPARVPTPPPAAPIPKPVQQASLPSPSTPAGADSFNGLYTAFFNGSRGALQAQIEIEGTKIVGFASGAALCRIAGEVDASGVIQRFVMECPNSSWSFSGQFSIEGESETTARSDVNTRTVKWKRITVARTTSVAALPQGTLDGRYAGQVRGRHGILAATIDVQGTKITGFASGPYIASVTAICKISGVLDPDGTIQLLDMHCPNDSWRFTGTFKLAGNGTYEAETAARSTTANNHTVVWKREGS